MTVHTGIEFASACGSAVQGQGLSNDCHHAEGENIGTGWTFTPPEVGPMMGAMANALETFHSYPDSWQKLMRSGMAQDLSWDRAARNYEELFEWTFNDPPQC